MMNHKVEALRANYVKRLGASRQRLMGLVDLLEADSTAVEHLRQLGHKLEGSGAIYGFNEVTESAKLLEQACRDDAQHQECPKVATQRLIDAISRAVLAKPSLSATELISKRQELSSVKVLIIEDDAEQADLMRAWLEESGAQVHTSSSIQQVRERLTEEAFDFILCDLELQAGQWSGVDFLRTRNDNDTTIIVITSNAGFDARLAAVRAGARAFIQKPFSAVQLNEALSAFVRNSSIADKRVLIVEDDEAQSQLYSAVLNTLGVIVHTVQDPKRAYETLMQQPIDLIITDVHLPICSGIELGRLIRHNPHFNHIPILFMSTDTSTDTKLSALEVAAEEFVSKPIEPWRLAVIVESRLRDLAKRF